jgi:hypothetical protein
MLISPRISAVITGFAGAVVSPTVAGTLAAGSGVNDDCPITGATVSPTTTTIRTMTPSCPY